MQDAHEEAPAVSVVMVTVGGFARVSRSLESLRQQTIREQLEIILVASRDEPTEIPPDAAQGFHSIRVEYVDNILHRGASAARGVRVARASIVALAEDHAYARPGWAEALMRAHTGNRAAVAPVIDNANPETQISRADCVLGFGPWMVGCTPGPRDHLPGHNGSYRRDLLLEFGDRLGDLMHVETTLQWELREKGYELYLEPAAVVDHGNFERWADWTRHTVHAGRVFAAARARNGHWSVWHRLLYVAGAPLIPFVRFARTVRGLSETARSKYFSTVTWGVLLWAYSLDAAGQVLGYAAGGGRSQTCVSHHALRRYDEDLGVS